MQITGWQDWTERREWRGERITARARYENEIGVRERFASRREDA